MARLRDGARRFWGPWWSLGFREIMVKGAVGDAFYALDWITARHVHEYFDVGGRPLGEGRAAAFDKIQTELQLFPNGGQPIPSWQADECDGSSTNAALARSSDRAGVAQPTP